ncbi:MAG: beta-lactamase family protein [Planctomycetes bacterium]|nr:beta-lactamase family protein [Planctomycetota bacterium]
MRLIRMARIVVVAGVVFAMGPFDLSVPRAGALDRTGRSPGPVVSKRLGPALKGVVERLDPESGGFYGSVLVAKKGEILLLESCGHFDEAGAKKEPIPVDAQWDWASVSKQFTAAAVLRLEQDGKLSIEDSIRKYFPELPDSHQPITLHHLLTHTSGLHQTGASGDPFARDRYVGGALAQMEVTAPPGEKWEYNNLTYGALAAVVEKVSRKTFEEYCRKALFAPARMSDTTFIGQRDLDLARVPKDDRGKGQPFAYGTRLTWGYRGAGGVVSTTIDMLRWHVALTGEKVLSAKSKERYYAVAKDDYACGWYVKQVPGETFYQHSGRVGESVCYFLRAEKADIVVAIVYGYNPEIHPEQTAYKLYRIAAR